MDTEALITARASELIDAGSPQGKAYRTAREEALDFCRHTADGDGFVFTCNRRTGHKGWHGQTVKLRDGYETTNWGDDGLAIHASRDEKRKKEGSRRDYPPYGEG